MRQFAREKHDITGVKLFTPFIDLKTALAKGHQVKAGLAQTVFG
jgi:hypothetical protein